MPNLQAPGTISTMPARIDPETLTAAEIEHLIVVHFGEGYIEQLGTMGTYLSGRWIDVAEAIRLLEARGYATDSDGMFRIEISGDDLDVLGSRAFTSEGAAVLGGPGRVELLGSAQGFKRIITAFERDPGGTSKVRKAKARTADAIRKALERK